MSIMASRWNDHFKASEQVHSEDDDEEEDVAFDEFPSSGHVINMYQCLNASQKKRTIEKDPPKQNN